METDLRQEFRSAEFSDQELDGYRFRGYAAVFDTPWSQRLVDRMGYVETVARGAFRKALAAGEDIPLLWQHNPRDMLATTKSGNLRIREDGKGLLVEAELPKTGLGEYVREMIGRGDVQGMSYGMETAPRDSIITEKDGVTHRSIALIRRLIDTTLTWDPAYDATTVELRAHGFVAVPLQELESGLEAQTLEAAAEDVPSVTSPYHGRLAAIVIDELEREGGYFR